MARPRPTVPRPRAYSARVAGPARQRSLYEDGAAGRRLSDGRRRQGRRSRNHDQRATRWRDRGRDHGPQQHRDEGISPRTGRDGEDAGRRLVPVRRPRGLASRWRDRDQGPFEGHHHFRRRKHLEPRGRGSPDPTSGRDAGRRRGTTRSRNGARRPAPLSSSKPGATRPDDAEVFAFCKSRLARFKVPKTLVFGPLPKTSTGKIQKFLLRDQAKSLEKA